MELVDVPDPGEPGPGEVLVRPEAVGLCGSDFHYFLGDLGRRGPQLYPRVQGHEAAGSSRPSGRAARASAGRRARRDLAADGVRSLLPVPDRPAERVREHQPDRDPPGRRAPGAAPHAGRPGLPRRRPGPGRRRPDRAGLDRCPRGRPGPGRGGGEGSRLRRRPDRSGRRSRGDRPGRVRPAPRPRREPRRARARRSAPSSSPSTRATTRSPPRGSGRASDGPEVVFEATGVPEVAQTAVELVAQAGRVVVVGLSAHDAPLRVGDLAVQGDRRSRRELLQRATSSPRRCRSSRGGRTRSQGS